jgi:DNA (cytosine-5)-methyltransferase 1
MRYLSVCSGIEAASVAWHPLGWTPVGFSEIEPFPSAVLAHRFPNVPNHGDMTKYKEWPIEPGTVDVLVGGTPCQSFSVAGLRKGLSDPRGGLMLTYLEIAQRLRPRWVVWENVPGVLSSGGGRDFGSFLGALGELGYGWAYRVLDAQWVRTHGHPRAVPQRRRRVFVVGCLGDGAAAASVLFERESVCRDSASSRTSREEVADDVGGCAASVCSKWSKGTGGPAGDECQNLTLQPVAIGGPTVMQAHAFYATGGTHGLNQHPDVSPAIKVGSGLGIPSPPAVAHAMTVRRLTPQECERLQGFPDDWTMIPWRGKSAEDCPDGPRYKALGNSMAVNVMAWIGERINTDENTHGIRTTE